MSTIKLKLTKLLTINCQAFRSIQYSLTYIEYTSVVRTQETCREPSLICNEQRYKY